MSVYSDLNLAGLIGNRALGNPDFQVLAVENGPGSQVETRTYRQLWKNGHQLARGLTRLGLQAGDCFALLMANHVEFVDAMVAAAITGTIFVPIDPRAKGDKLAYFLNNAQCKG
ncbi:MAG: AMP-binding protein, partial [Pseudomonas sp.]